MEGLVHQAFAPRAMVGKEVPEGHFDLIGPDGEIILPQVWETTVQPDWMITMHMWPKPDPPKPKAPPGLPGPPGHHHHHHGANLAAELQGLMLNGGGGGAKTKRSSSNGGKKTARLPGLPSFGLPRMGGALPPGTPPPPPP